MPDGWSIITVVLPVALPKGHPGANCCSSSVTVNECGQSPVAVVDAHESVTCIGTLATREGLDQVWPLSVKRQLTEVVVILLAFNPPG